MNISEIKAKYLDIATKYMRYTCHIVKYLDIHSEYPFYSV